MSTVTEEVAAAIKEWAASDRSESLKTFLKRKFPNLSKEELFAAVKQIL